jgi:hypothetical protein
MGSLLFINPFASMVLVLILIIFVICLLKSSWFKGIAGVVRETKNGPNRGYKFLDCTKFKGCKGTAVISMEDGLWQNGETQPAFTDSWENGLGPNDETQSAFTDRAFH